MGDHSCRAIAFMSETQSVLVEHYFVVYIVISEKKKTHMKDELKWFLKRGVGESKLCPPLSQPYLCTHVVILLGVFCHVFAYAITENSVCLHFLVPPLPPCVLLA